MQQKIYGRVDATLNVVQRLRLLADARNMWASCEDGSKFDDWVDA
jgi:hypothetical protein